MRRVREERWALFLAFSAIALVFALGVATSAEVATGEKKVVPAVQGAAVPAAQ